MARDVEYQIVLEAFYFGGVPLAAFPLGLTTLVLLLLVLGVLYPRIFYPLILGAEDERVGKDV